MSMIGSGLPNPYFYNINNDSVSLKSIVVQTNAYLQLFFNFLLVKEKSFYHSDRVESSGS